MLINLTRLQRWCVCVRMHVHTYVFMYKIVCILYVQVGHYPDIKAELVEILVQTVPGYVSVNKCSYSLF